MASGFLVGGFIGWCLFVLLRMGKREKYLPPGPPTIPLLGNLHLLTLENLHLLFTKWGREYGDVISVKIISRNMIVLSSATAVREVVDKMGWTAGSRPANFLFNDLCSDGLHTVFAGPTPELKAVRKGIAMFFSKQNTVRRSPIPAEGAQLLYEMLVNPSDFKSSVRRFTHSTIKTLTFGQRAPFFDSPDIAEFYQSMDEISRINSPGEYPPLDIMPFLKYVPNALAPWYAPARAVNQVRKDIRVGLYANVIQKMEKNEPSDSEYKCWVEWMLQTFPEVSQDFLSYAALVLLDGGSDTSGAYLLSLILTLSSNPEIQERAWKEVDSVIGARIPDRQDLQKMPFVRALIKEIFRLRPPFTMGFPHAMVDDVHYKGFVIPKGSTVFMNNYAISTDPDVFYEPETFNPDRYLLTEFGTIPGKDVNFRDSFIFGGGRRICPGQFVAGYTVELTTLRFIWAFEFGNAVDKKTKKIISPGLPSENFDFKLVVHPRPFDCSITPRPERARLLKEGYVDAMDELKRFEEDLLESDKVRLNELRQRLS